MTQKITKRKSAPDEPVSTAPDGSRAVGGELH